MKVEKALSWVKSQDLSRHEVTKVIFHLKDETAGRNFVRIHGNVNYCPMDVVEEYLAKFPSLGNTHCFEVRLFSGAKEIHFDGSNLYMNDGAGKFGYFRGFHSLANIPTWDTLIAGQVGYAQ